jgi:CRISPR-associated endonuclease Csn1
LKRLQEFNNDPKKAFTGKNSLDKNPVFVDEMHAEQVPLKVKLVSFEDQFTIRKPIAPDLKIEKVIDAGIRNILEERLKEYGGDAKKAFSNLDEKPIYLNKEKGITIKRVKIKGVSNATALHDKHDHLGNLILDEDGNTQPTDFVSTSNNHHVAIYRKPSLDKNGQVKTDEDGNVIYELEENVVSFFEATSRVNMGLPIIDKEYKKEEGWQFLFTMKQNEYFVFPRYETIVDENGNEQQIKTFDPKDIDLMNPDNYALISKNLYRVQKIATRNYFFRHHLEPTVETPKELSGITYKPQLGLNGINGIVKVRVNHIGQIVYVGEY